MKGRTLQSILLIILLMYLQINIFTNAHADIIKSDTVKSYGIVDKTGGGDYKTIQDAVNNAPDDSTIYITAGIYNETINIKNRIKLVGEDKDKTIINPISEENKYAICLGAPGVIISNLNITNGAPGLYTTAVQISAPNTKIYNCNIHDTPIGIAIWTSNNTIENCIFNRCSDEGIALLGSKYSQCNNNRITNCIFYDNCDGIEMQYSSNNIISHCSFYENSHMGIDAIASSNNENTISNCEIYNNAVNGIYLASSSNNNIIDCSISNNRDGDVVTTKNSFNNDIENSEPSTITQDKQKGNILMKRIFSIIPNAKTIMQYFY